MMLMKGMEYIKLKNGNRFPNSVDRDTFICLKLEIPSNGTWMKRVFSDAEKIYPYLNLGQANTSEKRDPNMVEIDNLSGMIAEEACETVLKWQFGENNIIKPYAESSINQIDLQLSTGRTIEVRSSCVRNGIDFAVFAKNDVEGDEQYFDVIGPYSNGYKPGEYLKDYYMRVLYWCDKKKFMDLFQSPSVQLFITGGATNAMMCDTNYFQKKHLVPAGGQVQVESDYRVVPLGKSLDAKQFIEVIARENNFNFVHRLI